jgi:hypothetical protein
VRYPNKPGRQEPYESRGSRADLWGPEAAMPPATRQGSFPTEDAARKLVYLALQNAVPQWTKTRNWTAALLAFKIHFGERVPDTAN